MTIIISIQTHAKGETTITTVIICAIICEFLSSFDHRHQSYTGARRQGCVEENNLHHKVVKNKNLFLPRPGAVGVGATFSFRIHPAVVVSAGKGAVLRRDRNFEYKFQTLNERHTTRLTRRLIYFNVFFYFFISVLSVGVTISTGYVCVYVCVRVQSAHRNTT